MNSAVDASLSGYLTPDYAASFRTAGEIVTLPQSGLSLIRRELRPGVCDLIGLYPYSMCRDFAALAGPQDRATLRATGAVAVSFVADPFATETVRTACAHWALCRPYKTHFVIDLTGDWRAGRSKHTRYYVRRGLRVQQADHVPASRAQARTFWRLYQSTLARHQVTGLAHMSSQILAAQFAVPGACLITAAIGGQITGAILSYVHASHVNNHLLCFDQAHYDDHTSYVLIDAAAAHAEALGCRWYNLGGSAGARDDPDDGLYRFKRRWTPHRRETTLCGDILDPGGYAALCDEAGCKADEAFFPAYRRPGSRFEWAPQL